MSLEKITIEAFAGDENLGSADIEIQYYDISADIFKATIDGKPLPDKCVKLLLKSILFREDRD